ncbi:MAG: orotate phosphoribosyltransferase [Candidatus Omnitrophica bacterium]|nr:orotate phosphoribosyltransferase [Candidatus Omnitrophota bacterium]
MNIKEKLLKLLKEKAVIIGERKLSSGKISNYYIDGRLITLDPEGLYLVGKIIFDMIKESNIDAIGGLTIGADPIVSSVSVISYIEKSPIKSFIVRTSQKDHGMGKEIEGYIKKGWNIAIVDDVVTTGGSILKVIEKAEKIGCRVKKIIVIVDRQEGAKEILKEKGYILESIFTKNNFQAGEEI